jgi:hypothetical protein
MRKKILIRNIASVIISIVILIIAYFLIPNIAQSQYDKTYRECNSELNKLDSKIYIPEGKVNHMKILDERWDEYIITVDQKEYELHEPYQRDRYDDDYHDDNYIPEDMSLSEVIYNAIRVNDTIQIYESGRLIINGKAKYKPNYAYPEEMAEEKTAIAFFGGWIIVFTLSTFLTFTSLCWEKMNECFEIDKNTGNGEEDIEKRALRLAKTEETNTSTISND